MIASVNGTFPYSLKIAKVIPFYTKKVLTLTLDMMGNMEIG